MTERLKPPADTTYRRWYERGWRYSGTENANLDFVPRELSTFSPEYDAWLDGYMDLAVGREKWHLAHCKNHHNSEGGCGKA